MTSITLLTCFILLIYEAHGRKFWGFGSTLPVDCLTSGWSAWSEPFFGGTATRTRSLLRRPAHGGEPCPNLIETKQTNITKTTQEVAADVTGNFLFQSVTRVASKRGARQMETVGQVRDLLVILDASGSIGSTNFKLAVNQIADLLGFMCPNPNPFDNNVHKLAVIRYSSQAAEIFDFNEYSTTIATLGAVRQISFTGGGTNTAAAFNLARDMITSPEYGARIENENVKPEVLILTDGQSNNAAQSIAAADLLKDEADVFGLIIGDFSSRGKDEILQYVSNPIQNHLFSVSSFEELEDLVNEVRIGVQTHQCAPFV